MQVKLGSIEEIREVGPTVVVLVRIVKYNISSSLRSHDSSVGVAMLCNHGYRKVWIVRQRGSERCGTFYLGI